MNIDRHITEVMEQVCDLCKACPAEAALKAALAAVENETAETFAKAIAGAFEDIQVKYGLSDKSI